MSQARRLTSDRYYEYKILLTKPAFKGTFESDTILVRSGVAEGACGYAFELGKKYIIYGYNSNPIPNESNDRTKQFWTNICTRTAQFNEREQKSCNE